MTSEIKQVKEQRLYELDGLRGIACVMVLLFHYTKYMHKNYNFEWQFLYGVTGVDLFFIISGFVIYMTLTKTSELKEFVVSRFTRLYPVFWFAVIVTSVFCLLANYESKYITVKNVFINLTMVPSLLGGKYIDHSYWTLLVELQFYFIIAFFYFFIKQISALNKSLVLFFILVILHAVSVYFDHGKKIIYYMPILAFWNLFLTGILLYEFRKDEKKSQVFGWLVIAVSIVFVYYTHKQAGMSQYYLNAFEHSIIDTVYVFIFYFLINNKLPFLKNKILVFLGGISYSIYLLHQTVGYILLNIFQRIFNNSIWSMVITAFCILIISYLTNKFIEKPLMVKFRMLFEKISGSKKTSRI